ncbi:MAG: hypothetical protein WBQ64_06350 [Terriglobales bacterium]
MSASLIETVIAAGQGFHLDSRCSFTYHGRCSRTTLTMRRILAYGGHLLVATLAVPWLTMMAAGLVHGVFSPFLASVDTPQQLYSDHLIFLVVVVGMLLSYGISGKFSSGSALWVWIPAIAVFVFRVLQWRASGSALVGSGSLVEHFFTVNCQIRNWREAGFGERCDDKLFLTPLLIGSLSYSAGAAIGRIIHGPHPPEETAAASTAAEPSPRRIITSQLGALLALILTGSSLGGSLHAEMTGESFSWTWLFSGVLPAWLVLPINIAFWAAICFTGIGFARAELRKEEKGLLVSMVGYVLLIPVAALFARIGGTIRVVQTMLSLTAFLAALVILLSLLKERFDPQSPQGR